MNTKILGNSVTITSRIQMDDLLKLKKFAPQALKSKDDKGNVIYAVGVGQEGAISTDGVTFNGKNPEGFAQITLGIPAVDNKTDYVKENYGLAMLSLSEIESTLVEAVTDINERFNSVAANITQVD